MVKSNIVDFVRKAKCVHGDAYDYSKAVYVNSKTPLLIVCEKHGEFFQKPNSHLSGEGCPFCGIDKKKSPIRGVGINDTYVPRTDPAFKCWSDILRRCYPVTEHEVEKWKAYSKCSVCDEWLKFSNFWYWFQENHVENYSIDKDLFSEPDNKIYSPSTCCFLPREINSLLQCEHVGMRKSENGLFYNKSKKVYEAKFQHHGKCITIGKYSTEEEAIDAYIQAKTDAIRQSAEKYYSEGKISQRVYYGLLNFKVIYGNKHKHC